MVYNIEHVWRSLNMFFIFSFSLIFFMRAPAGAPIKLLITKFDLLSLDTLIISILCYSLIFLISITFIARNYHSCDLLSHYDGVQIQESGTQYYIIASIHSPKEKQTFSTFFIELYSNPYPSYQITADILCQWNHAPSAMLRKSLLQAKSGKNKVYSTGLFNYDSVLFQIHLNGDLSKLFKVTITLAHTSPEFFAFCNKLKSLFSKISIVTFSLYLFSFLFFFGKQRRKLEHLFVLLSLFLSIQGLNCTNDQSVLTNDSIITYGISLLFHGLYQSINYIVLYCLIILSTTQESLMVPLLLSSLYVMAAALNEVTQDSAILSTYFDNNDALSVFFFSITLLSQASFLFYSLYKLVVEISQSLFYTRPANYFLLILVLNQITALFSNNIFHLMKGYVNSALLFYSRYLSHFVTTIILADIYWPAPKRKDVKIRPALSDVLS